MTNFDRSSAIRKYFDARASEEQRARQESLDLVRLEQDVASLGFIQEELDPIFLSSPAAEITEDDLKTLDWVEGAILAVEKMQGPKGEDGYTPQKGIDYFDGKDGKDGKSIVGPKGDKGDRGDPGLNGLDAIANMEEVTSEIEKRIKRITFPESNPFLVGTKVIDETDIADGKVIQYDLKKDKLVYVEPRKEKKGLLSGRGLSLPSQSGNAGKFLTTDGQRASWATASGGAGNWSYKETPSGLVNDSNVTFVLAQTPIAGSTHLYRNGVLQDEGDDYTVSSATITFATAPETGDKIRTTYQYA